MDVNITPPPIPSRARQHARRKSLQGPSAHSSNRVHVQPASPEVISSLITSLSIISSPATELFDQSDGFSSLFTSPGASYFSSGGTDRHSYNKGLSKGGSFGIDYGAFR